MFTSGRSGILVAGALLVAACGDNLPGRGTYAADAAIEEGEAMGGALADQAAEELDEADPALATGQIGAILLALDEGEVAQAEVALELGRDPAVQDLAVMLADEHSRHADAVSDLLLARGIAPAEGAASGALRREAAAGIDELEQATAFQVDYTYLRLQVRLHAAGEVLVGELVDLAPDDPELRGFLEATRALLAAHLAEAEALLRAR